MLTNDTPLSTLHKAVNDFRDARNWRQFHSPKNLSMSIAIEAAELMEHFQWLTVAQAESLAQAEPEVKAAIAEELADVLIYSFSLADVLECDIGQIMLEKLAKNEERYPADQYRDRF